MPSNEALRVAINKLARLVAINDQWYFKEILDVATAANPICKNLLYYCTTLDKLGPWNTIWEEDQDLRDS